MIKRYWLFLAILSLMVPLNSARAGDGDDDEDGLKIYLKGFLRSDVRYGLPKMNPFWCKKGSSSFCHGAKSVSEPGSGFTRNENTARLRLAVRSGSYKAVAELDFVYAGYARELEDLGLLANRSNLDPFAIEAHALYFDITDFLVKGLDIRIGQQIVTWGKADMFNPTSNINALDLEDALLFGDRVANSMLKVDYNPYKDWILSFVWVPFFRPNQLPASAVYAVKGVDRIPMVSEGLRRRLHVERDWAQSFLRTGMPTVVTEARPVLPEYRIENSQVGFKVAGKAAKMDFSLSYYYGRSGIPQPFVERVYDGDSFLDARTALMYPKMHVIGFDWAGQIPLGKLGGGGRGIGFWVEAAVFFPQRVVMPIYNNDLPVIGDGEYDYNASEPGLGTPPTIVDSKPFVKWVVGLDYTFNRHVFVNVQWVHGFVDEFGAGSFLSKGFIPTKGFTDLDVNNDGVDDLNPTLDCFDLGAQAGNGNLCAKEYLRPRLGDYLVAGMDFRFYKSKMLFRLFFILDLSGVHIEEWVARDPNNPTVGRRERTHKNAFTGDGFSMVVFPSLTWSVGSGVELSAGAFWMIGKTHTKFGDTATGGSVVFAKGRFLF